MDVFLQSVEQQAYRIALINLRHPEDALDAVQESMLRFVQHYRTKNRESWKPLFYKILYNQMRTMQRKKLVRDRWFSWILPRPEIKNPIEAHPDPRQPEPERIAQTRSAYRQLEQALTELSSRQQQAVVLRVWEGLSVAETAAAMGCSEGSVKTHCARAVHQLRLRLGDYWP